MPTLSEFSPTSLKVGAKGVLHLRMPLLPRLLGSDQAKQYRYRVTNLLGSEEQPGATSEELEGEGDDNV